MSEEGAGPPRAAKWFLASFLLHWASTYSGRLGETAVTYSLLRFAHLIGLMLMGAGLIGVWISDLRSRKVRELVLFAEAVRNIAVFYDGAVVPGALILMASGAWMTADVWGGWGFMQHPWLA